MSKTAKEFNINRQTISDWKKLEESTGSLAKRPLERSFKKIDPQRLKEIYDKNPDAFQKDVAKEFNVCQSSIQRALKRRLRYSRKKNFSLQRTRPQKATRLFRKNCENPNREACIR